MSTVELLEKIERLPPGKKKEIEALIDEALNTGDQAEPKKIRKAGFAKGSIKMLPGFDDPIPGMEEYM